MSFLKTKILFPFQLLGNNSDFMHISILPASCIVRNCFFKNPNIQSCKSQVRLSSIIVTKGGGNVWIIGQLLGKNWDMLGSCLKLIKKHCFYQSNKLVMDLRRTMCCILYTEYKTKYPWLCFYWWVLYKMDNLGVF